MAAEYVECSDDGEADEDGFGAIDSDILYD